MLHSKSKDYKMWIHLFSEKTGAVRVPSLKQHMIQNNDILKFIFREKYLPSYQRLNIIFRGVRLLISVPIMIMMATAALNNIYGSEAYDNCLQRAECLSNCQSLHFLQNSCDKDALEVASITYNGNTYSNLYQFYYDSEADFSTCYNFVDQNPSFP